MVRIITHTDSHRFTLSCQAEGCSCSIRVIRGFPPEDSGGERDAVAHESDMCPKSVPGSCQGPDEPAHS